MNIEIDVGTLVFIVFGLVSGFWAMSKLLLMQIEKTLKAKFDAVTDSLTGQNKEFEDIKRRLEQQEESDRSLERGLAALREALPRDYVRREDFTRVIASFEVKVDNLRLEIQRWFLQKGN